MSLLGTLRARTAGQLACATLTLAFFGACSLPDYAEYAQPLPRSSTPDSGASGADSGSNVPDAGSDASDDAGLDAGSLICPTGFADCNGARSDGCETALGTVQHCGDCGVACGNDHGTTACNDSGAGAECSPVCAAGFADCDLNPSNGCETNIQTDSTHCGSCDMACPANGGTPLCAAGKCGISKCNDGFGDCSNEGACTVNLNTDPNNCGHCGHVCSSSNGTPRCNGGVCEITCNSGYGDCNATTGADGGLPPDDGCETKLNVLDANGSVPNCGACGNACVRRSFTTIDVAQCAQGVCARDCFAGEGDCDNNRNDPSCHSSTCGCETYLGSDVNNCGACGHVCKGGGCGNDKCDCPDSEPKSGSTTCSLASTVTCGVYGTSCNCVCSSGVFKCTDSNGKAC